MSVTRKVAYNTGVQIAGRVAGLGLSLVGVAYLTRYLGPEGFGNYSIAFLYAAIATMITDLGIYTIGLREMAHSDDPERMGSNVMALKTMLQLPLYALLTVATIFLPYPDEVKAAVAVAILGAAIASITTTINLFFQYRLRLDFTVAVDILVKALSVGLIIWLVNANAGFLALVSISPITVAIGVVAGAILFAANRFKFRPKLTRAEGVRLLKASLPLGLVTVLGFLHFKADSVILSVMQSSYDVGIYAIAYKVIEMVVVFPGFYIAAVFPIVAKYFSDKNPKLNGAIQRSFDFMSILGLPMLCGVLATAPSIIKFLGGEGFDEAVLPLQILMFAGFFSFLNVLFSNMAIIFNLQRKIVLVSATSLSVNVILNLIVIPKYSYLGAAATTVASELVGLVLILWLVRGHIRKPLRLGVPLKALAAAVVMAVVAYFAVQWMPLLVVLPVCAVLYGALLLAFRAVGRDDIKGLMA